MNRRSFINNLALGTASVALFSRVSNAQTVPTDPTTPQCPPPVVCPPPLSVKIEILNNHGHDGIITYESVIIGDTLNLNIQGKSGHGHTLILSEEELTLLRKNLTVDVKSSVDFNHAHMVRITRDVVP